MTSFILLSCVLVLTPRLLQVSSLSSHVFRNLQTHRAFVDKTELLKIFFDHANSSSSPPYFFISNPRRFGKTSHADMIYWFASIQHDKNGDPLTPNQTASWDSFRKMKIFNHTELVSEHLGRYVVLHLELMGIGVAINTIEQVVQDIGTLFYYEMQTFPRLKALVESEQPNPGQYGITEQEMQFLRNVANRNMTAEDAESSVFLMVKLLSQIYNTKVILIFHQYDETALNSYIVQKSYVGPVYKYLNTVILKGLTFGRPYLKFAVIHSVSTLGYALNHELRGLVKHYPFLEDHEFTPYYAFTESEAEELFDRFRCEDAEKEILRKHYGGYKDTKGTTYYGTFSLATYLFYRSRNGSQLNPPPSYVHKSITFGRLAIFMSDPTFRSKIFDIYENGTMEYAIRKISEPEALHQLERLRDRRFHGVLPHHVPMLFTQCFEMGFFSHVPGTNHTYTIPNGEIKQMFKEEIETYYKVYQRA